jgi:hypothetical protein
MNREDVIRLAERAGIVFRLGSTDVTVEKLVRFLELVEGYKTRGWRIKEPEARKVTDVSRGAREVKIDYRDPDIRVSRAEGAGVRGFWIFWLRPEGGYYMPGLNFTRLPNGFTLAFCTSTVRYRFRFRRGIKPRFLWSKGL